MLPDLLILRHGQTEWNRIGQWQGRFDSPLTALGRAQAVGMAVRLAAEGVGPGTHVLWTSPQGRAMATAAEVARATGLVAHTDSRLREIGVGAWAGLGRSRQEAAWPGPPDEHFLDRYARAPGGETFAALMARALSFLASLDAPAVIVTHGITSRALRSAALGLGEDGLRSVPGGQGVIHRIAAGEAGIWHAADDASDTGRTNGTGEMPA